MTMTFSLAGVDVKPGEKAFAKIRVARRLMGADFYIPVHIIAGAMPGPVLGVMNAVHGDEVLPIPAMRDVVAQVEPEELSGVLVVVPVANPIAFAAGSRQTPDTWDRNNLWRAFPGNPKGTITEQMGAVISNDVMPALDALIEVHSGGIGRLQNRVEYDGPLAPELKKRTFDLAVSFGTELVHESPVPTDGPTGYINSQGRPGFQVEVGCSFLTPAEDAVFRESISQGVMNVMRFMGDAERRTESAGAPVLVPKGRRQDRGPPIGGRLSPFPQGSRRRLGYDAGRGGHPRRGVRPVQLRDPGGAVFSRERAAGIQPVERAYGGWKQRVRHRPAGRRQMDQTLRLHTVKPYGQHTADHT